MFSGLYTALITPFRDKKIDEKAFEALIERQVKAGVSGIVPCGTTGESPTLNHQEHNLAVKLAAEIADKRIQIIAGTGSNSTREAIMMTNHAKEAGADACLVVAPYYNKPTQEGLFQHFKAINDKCDVPLIIYNIPGRSVIDISDQTTAKLAKLKNIAGIKDATGDLARVATLRKLVDKDFSILSGEDATAVGFNAMGGHGVISVTANIVPEQVNNLQKLCLAGKYDEALKLQDSLTDLHMAMFCETSPVPAKYAASLMGLCLPDLRLPLVELSDQNKQRVEKVLKDFGLV